MEEEGKTFHKLQVLGLNDLWDRVRAFGIENWKGCKLSFWCS